MNDKVINLGALKHYNDIVKEALRKKANTTDIPTKTSQLQNDSGFITSANVPTKTSQLQNDSGFITSSDIPTRLSQFINDPQFITLADVPENTYATNSEIDDLF